MKEQWISLISFGCPLRITQNWDVLTISKMIRKILVDNQVKKNDNNSPEKSYRNKNYRWIRARDNNLIMFDIINFSANRLYLICKCLRNQCKAQATGVCLMRHTRQMFSEKRCQLDVKLKPLKLYHTDQSIPCVQESDKHRYTSFQ